MKISVCMIVKNEERCLDDCLQSVASYADEIVIVDTGSSDNTIEIAKTYNARVYQVEWKQDFGWARNQSLQYATGDWILVLDADECVMGWDENIKEILQHTKFHAMSCEMIQKKEGEETRHHVTRLFRNHIGIRYQGKIHEQLTKNEMLLGQNEIGNIALKVLHSGYRTDIMQIKEKDERNLSLLLQEVKDRPKDKLVHFHLANQYVRVKDYMNAMYHYKIATENKQNKEIFKHAILKMIWCLHELERFSEMFTLFEEGKKMFPHYTDIYYAQAEILDVFGHEEEAILLYQECLRLGESVGEYYSKRGVGSVLSLRQLASIYRKQLRFQEELDCLQKISMLQLHNIEVITRYLELIAIYDGMTTIPFLIEMMYPNGQMHTEEREQVIKWYELFHKKQQSSALILFEENVEFSYLETLVMKGYENIVLEHLLQLPSLTVEEMRMIAELSLQLNIPMQTIQYANQMLQMDNRNFRAMNLLLLSCKTIGETEQANLLAKEMLELMPYDAFFQSFLKKNSKNR